MGDKLTFVVAFAGVLLYLAAARKFIGFDPPSYVTPQTYDVLAAKFRHWETLSAFIGLVFAAALGGAWYAALAALARLHLRSLGPSLYVIAPPALMWAVPAGILGLLSAALPLHLLYRRLLGDGYEDYTLYTNLKYRFDTWKAYQIVGALMALLILVLIVFGMDCYVRLTPDEVIVNPIAGLGETRHSYRQVKAVEVVLQRRAPSGELIDRPYPEIEFQDGSRFDPYDVLLDEEPDRDMKLLKLIAQQSRKKIRTIQSIDNRGN